MPFLKLQMWTFANAGLNHMWNGRLRDPILPLFTQRVLPFGVALDFKKSPGWPILEYNLSTFRLAKNTLSLLVPTLIQGTNLVRICWLVIFFRFWDELICSIQKIFTRKLNIFYVSLSQLPFWPNNMALLVYKAGTLKIVSPNRSIDIKRFIGSNVAKHSLKNLYKDRIFLILFVILCISI